MGWGGPLKEGPVFLIVSCYVHIVSLDQRFLSLYKKNERDAFQLKHVQTFSRLLVH